MKQLDILTHRLHLRLGHRIRASLVAHLCEAVCAWKLEDSCPHFIFAAEGAPFDAGLVIGSHHTLPQDGTARLFYTLEHLADCNVVLPVEIKSVSSQFIPSWRGCAVYFRMHLKEAQRAFGIVIIMNTQRPDLIVVAPRPLIKGDTDGHTYEWEHEYLTGQEPQPLPIPLMPLTMPFDFLPQALQAAEDWCKNPTAGWYVTWSSDIKIS